jgi:NAD-dependent dihydropyrimidine dehydrogenase PreA subunit
VESDKAIVDAETCIDCGTCIDECPVNAITAGA